LDARQIRPLILEVRKKFPRALWADVPEWIDRDVLHAQLMYVPDGKLIDLGGGYSPISAVLARLGMSVTVVDTFASTRLYEQFSARELCDILESFGVKLVKSDLREYDPTAAFAPASVDAIDCFGTINLFNPRRLLDRCISVLKPGGTFVVECSNGASLGRRLRLLAGRNNTDTFQQYFFDDWHTRAWTEGDVHALAAYLKLSDYRVLGRNWSLYKSRERLPRPALRLTDNGLRLIPGLCNDIDLIGRK
jgi:SAM-dependent methyltransferase